MRGPPAHSGAQPRTRKRSKGSVVRLKKKQKGSVVLNGYSHKDTGTSRVYGHRQVDPNQDSWSTGVGASKEIAVRSVGTGNWEYAGAGSRGRSGRWGWLPRRRGRAAWTLRFAGG